MSGDVLAVFIAVVGARFLLPLLIPRYPLPAIIACLVLDGDRPDDLPGLRLRPARLPELRQGDGRLLPGDRLPRDDAELDEPARVPGQPVPLLLPAGRRGRFELTQVRALLLIFPNTFEYFFIAYEAVRSRWSTAAVPARAGGVTAAALIWVFVKLPQEYWIHVAQLDVTDILSENAWAPPLLVAMLLALVRGVLVPGPAAAAAARLGAGGWRPTRCPRRWTPPPSSPPGTRSGGAVRSWATAGEGRAGRPDRRGLRPASCRASARPRSSCSSVSL